MSKISENSPLEDLYMALITARGIGAIHAVAATVRILQSRGEAVDLTHIEKAQLLRASYQLRAQMVRHPYALAGHELLRWAILVKNFCPSISIVFAREEKALILETVQNLRATNQYRALAGLTQAIRILGSDVDVQLTPEEWEHVKAEYDA